MLNMRLAPRVVNLKPSVTVAFMNRAKAMKAQGLDVLSFAAGEPDFDTPQKIKDAAIAALLAGQTKYMPTMGDVHTRRVIAEKFERENGIMGLTPEHIGIASGGKHSLFVACHVLFDVPEEGQQPWECLLPVPAWVSYAPIVQLAGGRVVEVPTTVETGFKASAAQIRAAITPQTRMVVLNSPSNPCGTMYTPDELREIAAVCDEAARSIAPDLVILSDELYEKIIYGGIEHFSIGSVPSVAERTLTINGLSKAYGMTGWRVGYSCMPGTFGLKLTGAMATLQGQMSTNITSFVYPAIRTALTECASEVEAMRQAFASRAEVTNARLARIPGVKNAPATGAFYAFPDVSSYFGTVTPAGKKINSALDMCEALLAESLLAFVPGEDFGGCGANHVRISFACGQEQINKGMDRFEAFLGALRRP
jgi:aspartate aminotransferase